MSVWLDLGLAAAAVNLLVLAVLGTVWFRNYRRHGASHTLGLLVFGGLWHRNRRAGGAGTDHLALRASQFARSRPWHQLGASPANGLLRP